jgi:hypothetical protein
MGKVIARKIKGMTWSAKIGLTLVCTLLISVFMYQGWYQPLSTKAAIGTTTSWTSLATTYHTSTKTPSANIAVSGSASTGRVLVVGITYVGTTAGTATCSMTYGGTPLTLAAGDAAATSSLSHTWIFYLPENNTLMDGTTKALATTVTSSTTGLMTDGYYLVLNGVDQLNPLGSSARPTANRTAISGSSIALSSGSGILINANEQAVALYESARLSSTSSLTLSSFLTNWTNTVNQSSTSTNSNHSYPVIRSIPTSNLSEELVTATASSSSAVTSVTAVSFRPGPTVTGAAPSSAAPGTTLDVAITGTGFVSSAAASFSGTGITVNSTTFNSATSLTANITIAGGAASGLRNITVTGANGTAVGTSLFSVVSATAPTVSSVASIGQGATNANVTFTGTNFVVGGTTVTVSGANVTVNSVTVNSATSLTANLTVAGTATIGARDITVTNPDTSSSSKVGALTINTRPTITSVSPANGRPGDANKVVTITGTGFTNGAPLAASFGSAGITVNSTTFVSATQITANISIDSAATASNGTVSVINGDYGVPATNGSFSVVTLPAPTITSLSTTALSSYAANLTVTIVGTNFLNSPAPTVTCSAAGVVIGGVTYVDANTLKVVIVSNSNSSGSGTLTVTNNDSQSATSGTITFNNSRPGSSATASPSIASTGANNLNIAITGSGYLAGAQASFSGTGITVNSTTFNSTTSLTVNINVDPAATAGARSLVVTNPDGGTRSVSNVLTITPVGVSSVSPQTIAQGATGTVTITGQGFASGATAVISGGGLTVNSLTYVNATTLTASITANSSASVGARDITVTVGANSGSGAGVLTVTAGPTVSAFTPAFLRQGQVNQDVVISGLNFVSGATVQFNGTGVTLNSVDYSGVPTQLTANVSIDQNAPLASQSVTVTNPDGGNVTGGVFTIALTGKTIPGNVSFTKVTTNSIAMVIAFAGDGDNDGSCSVAYGTTANYELGTVTAVRGSGTYGASFNNLQGGRDGAGKLYYFKVTFADGDGIVGNSQILTTQPSRANQLIHNSQNTYSTKWNQGWGIDGGKYGAFSCSTCHSSNTTNSALVSTSFQAATLENWSSSGTRVLGVTYRNPATDLGNDASHATSTNPCEACHSRTGHHKYNNPVANHKGTTDCTACHSHNEGFLPSCQTCHSTAQGPGGYRRQIVGNGGDFFTNMSTHGKFTGLSSQTCTACHDATVHQSFADGVSVALKNADTGASVVYDGTAATAATTASVCISCHDADGASRLGVIALAPFTASGDYRTPTNISQYWSVTNGAHIVKMQCMNCHGNSNGVDGSTTNPKYNAHASGNKHVLQDRAYDVVNPNSYCFNCHNAASTDPNKSSKDIAAQFALANKHVTAKCFDCHGDESNSIDSLHSLKAGSETAGSGVIANNISNATGRNLTWSGTSWSGASASAGLASNTVTGEYQVCFKCHAAIGTGTTPDLPGSGTAAASLTNLALEFNPNNASGHPIVTGLNNYPNSAAPKALTAAKMKAPWNVNLGTQVMTCSDCHATDSTASKGPHGSSVKWMLAGTNKAWPYTTAAGNGTATGTLRSIGNYSTGSGTKDGLFCLNCHTVTASNNFHVVAASFPDEHNSTSGPAMCASCHIRVPHGGKIARLLQTTNVPNRYKSNGSSTAAMYSSWGHTGTPIKGAAYSGNFASGSCTHHSTSGGEAW